MTFRTPLPARWGAPWLGVLAAVVSTLPAQDASSAGPSARLAPADQPRFVENTGAWADAVRFAVLGGDTMAWVHDDGWSLRFERAVASDRPGGGSRLGAVVRFRVLEAATTSVVGQGAYASPVHHLIASSASTSPTYECVRLADVAPGVDLALRPDPESGRGPFAYDLHLDPGASLASVEIRCEGSRRLRLDESGALCVTVPLPDGQELELRQPAPVSWTASGSKTIDFRLLDENTFGFVARDWDGDEELTVDPGFIWSTFLGGGSSDRAFDIDASGDSLVVVGFAGSSDFPTTTGAFQVAGETDGFITKLTKDGRRILFSTYIGGRGAEEIRAVDVTPSQDIIIGGWTGSDDFPVTAGAFQTQYFGGSLLKNIGDGFVARVRSTGAALSWCTFLGRVGDDFVRGVHADPGGTVTVVGETDSDAFPTTAGSMQPAFGSQSVLVPDAFITRFAANGRELVWSTYFGAAAMETLEGFDVAADGSVWICGLSGSIDFPASSNAFQRSVRGIWDGYVAHVSGDGARLEAATLFGGDDFGQVRAVAIGPAGDVFIGGVANTDEPFVTTAGEGWQQQPALLEDGYVARLSPNLSRLIATTWIAGSARDVVEDLAFDEAGRLYVAGSTESADLEVGAGAPQRTYGGGAGDGFVYRLSSDLGMVESSTLIGGSDKDTIWAIDAVDERVYAAGTTFSFDLPIAGIPAQRRFGGVSDAFVTAFDASLDRRARVLFEPTTLEGRTFAPGQRFAALAGALTNRTGTAVRIQSVTLAVAGAADAARDVRSVTVYRDRNGDGVVGPSDSVLAGPFVPDTAAYRVGTPLALELQAGERLDVVVEVVTRATCRPGVEFSVLLGAGAGIVVRRTADQRRVLVEAPSVTAGPEFVCSAREQLTPDVDGDGRITVLDVRRLAAQQGVAALPGLDPDGDGMTSSDDVEAVLARVLGRPVIQAASETRSGGVLAISGFDLGDRVRATLAGVPLVTLVSEARRMVFDVPESLPAGQRQLELWIGDQRLSRTTIIVR